jgi:hypothetical protein
MTASPTSTSSRHADGFDVLDACHGQMVFTLGKLSALVARLAASGGPDAESRELARARGDMGREMAARRRAERRPARRSPA